MKKILKWGTISIVALIVLITVIAVASGGSKSTSSPGVSPSATPVITQSIPPGVAAPSSAPATAPATSASASPSMTAAQAQALQSAQSYLSDGQGFSQAGLIAQLDSPAGGQFSVGDATWAVDHSGADWNAQAVISAKSYMSDGQGFSRSGLIAQLDSPDGGQFTEAQAAYAVAKVGL